MLHFVSNQGQSVHEMNDGISIVLNWGCGGVSNRCPLLPPPRVTGLIISSFLHVDFWIKAGDEEAAQKKAKECCVPVLGVQQSGSFLPRLLTGTQWRKEQALLALPSPSQGCKVVTLPSARSLLLQGLRQKRQCQAH